MIVRGRTRLALALAAGLALLPCAAWAQDAEAAPESTAASSTSEGWSWVAAPYLWASAVSTDLREDSPPVESETEFSDIISKIDMAAQVHVEGQGERFGLFGDLTYLSLGDSSEHPRTDIESSLDFSIFELAGVWNVSPERFEGLDLFLGVRHLSANADVKFDPVNPALPQVERKLDQSFSDLMIGARYSASLSERWGSVLRIDASGGDTEGTVNASALLNYRVGKGSWLVGYRWMRVELDAGGQDVNVTMNGPIFAFAFGL